MNPTRRTIGSAALPMVLATFVTIAPFPSTAHAQTLREAGTAKAQEKSCQAQALEWLKECEAAEKEDEEEEKKAGGVPDRSGLGWTGIGLLSAGGALVVSAATVDRWRSCGPSYVRHCQNLERVYGISGGTLLATGLTFLIIDEVRRHPEPYPKRQTAIAIGPRAIQIRMLF